MTKVGDMVSDQSFLVDEASQQAASEARALRFVEMLMNACHRLSLDPRDDVARDVIARVETSLSEPFERERSLRKRLADEVRAHSRELTVRFELGMGDSLQIRTAASRLYQTATFLQAQLPAAGSSQAIRHAPMSPQFMDSLPL